MAENSVLKWDDHLVVRLVFYLAVSRDDRMDCKMVEKTAAVSVMLLVQLLQHTSSC